jgi:hypothetical protein
VFRKSGYRFCDKNSRKAKNHLKEGRAAARHELGTLLVGRKAG